MPRRLPILRVNKWPRRTLQFLLQLLIIFFPFLTRNWWGSYQVCLWPSTDVPIAFAKVCFEEKSGSGADLPPCRTLTQLGHGDVT